MRLRLAGVCECWRYSLAAGEDGGMQAELYGRLAVARYANKIAKAKDTNVLGTHCVIVGR